MTDKEIIIDGVDVSGCEFYQIAENELYPKAQYCGSMRTTFCENEPNCYYKQLKRLEQENAELKAENERLKEEKENLIEQLVTYNQFENSYNKYRQTLQEIKEIAGGVRNYLQLLAPRDVRYEMDRILQKISEVK